MTDDQWYDLFESVAANLRHGNLTRKQQHEELARIVAAERERCAKLCEEVESQAWALWKTTADPIEQGRNIGAQHCADAIRA